MKYPKTLHLPFSPGLGEGDKVIKDMSLLESIDVVITEKLDGENTCMDRDGTHARSENSTSHPSRNLVKALHSTISYLILPKWQVFGENVYAKHSIEYPFLDSVFYVFAIFDTETQSFLSWKETVAAAKWLSLPTVPVLYEGPYKNIALPKFSKFGDQIEGYVVRAAGQISLIDFDKLTAKYVRADHVQTDEHWKKNWVPNPKWRK